jgi:hypothetical protein
MMPLSGPQVELAARQQQQQQQLLSAGIGQFGIQQGYPSRGGGGGAPMLHQQIPTAAPPLEQQQQQQQWGQNPQPQLAYMMPTVVGVQPQHHPPPVVAGSAGGGAAAVGQNLAASGHQQQQQAQALERLAMQQQQLLVQQQYVPPAAAAGGLHPVTPYGGMGSAGLVITDIQGMSDWQQQQQHVLLTQQQQQQTHAAGLGRVDQVARLSAAGSSQAGLALSAADLAAFADLSGVTGQQTGTPLQHLLPQQYQQGLLPVLPASLQLQQQQQQPHVVPELAGLRYLRPSPQQQQQQQQVLYGFPPAGAAGSLSLDPAAALRTLPPAGHFQPQ